MNISAQEERDRGEEGEMERGGELGEEERLAGKRDKAEREKRRREEEREEEKKDWRTELIC